MIAKFVFLFLLSKSRQQTKREVDQKGFEERHQFASHMGQVNTEKTGRLSTQTGKQHTETSNQSEGKAQTRSSRKVPSLTHLVSLLAI